MASDPIVRFKEILNQAAELGVEPHNAGALATAGDDCHPTVRMVLLKDVDDRGFVFYTNLQSHKAQQLKANPNAALCFWWAQLKRQVRIEGSIELVGTSEADEYFASRPRGSQLGAWASPQSAELTSHSELTTAVAALDAQYRDRPVPRPPFWSGYRLVPERIEFWQDQPDRLHDRELYTRQSDGWHVMILAP